MEKREKDDIFRNEIWLSSRFPSASLIETYVDETRRGSSKVRGILRRE